MARLGLPRTKIVATIGPASEEPSTLDRLLRAGVSVARINLAHGAKEDHERMVARVRAAARRARRPVAVMVDLAGPKIRIGRVQGGRMTLTAGRRVRLTDRDVDGTETLLSVTEPRLIHDLKRGDPVYLADGTLELRVLHVDAHEVECQIVSGGLLTDFKGVNVPRTNLRVPTLTDKDRRDLAHVMQIGVDAVALSFVREATDIHRTRQLMGAHPVPIVAKIEQREAVQRLDAILDAADAAMVARGDLAVETSLEGLPLLQKRIIRASNERAKPVITATQMLLSMVEQPRPTRAEAGDVANAILDGTDAVMLSEETARGKYPVRAVEMMARIAATAETALDRAAIVGHRHRLYGTAIFVSEAAVRVAEALRVKAIVTPTGAGATPRFVSRLRPSIPIVALTENPRSVPFLCFAWGVHPVHRPRLGGFEHAIRVAGEELRRLGLAGPGDRYVVTAGYPAGFASNLMTVQQLPKR